MSKPITCGIAESIYFMSNGRVPRSNRARWRFVMWSTLGYLFVFAVLGAYVYQAAHA